MPPKATTVSPAESKGVARPGQVPQGDHEQPAAPATNGRGNGALHVVPPPAGEEPKPVQYAGPRTPRRTREVPVPEYQGFTLTLWVNYPQTVYDTMVSGENKESLEAAGKIFIANNGWCDDVGVPYPPMNTDEFWKAIPNELAGTMLALARREANELPNSLLRQQGR